MSEHDEQSLDYVELDATDRGLLGPTTMLDLRTSAGIEDKSVEYWQTIIQEAESVVMVRDRRSNLLVGAGFLVRHTEDILEIADIAVRFEYKRHKIGTQIFERLFDTALSADATEIIATPRESVANWRTSPDDTDQEWQTKFLGRYGFVQTAEHNLLRYKKDKRPTQLPDQRELWDKKHARGDHAAFRQEPSPFGKEVETLLPKNALILELGCGVGGDANYFAGRGHSVIATDFSDVVIEQNREVFIDSEIDFRTMDIKESLKIEIAHLEAIFAHLSLHYFDDKTTRVLFAKIAERLQPGGIFAFACKTPNDYEYGKGREVEPNLFVADNDHIRHFFTADYARELLGDAFEVISMNEVRDNGSTMGTAFLQVITKKV